MTFQSKSCLVTGAGNGIGRALVLALLKEGATVFAFDRDQASLEALVKETKTSQKLQTYRLDITDHQAVETTLKTIIKDVSPVDAVFNVAGIIQPFVPVESLDYDTVRRVMDVNFYGTLYVIKTLLPHLKTRKEATITNISSMGGFVPVPGQTIYGASKAAIKLLSEGLNSELKDTNVSVTVVFPGGVETAIMTRSGASLDSLPDDVKTARRRLLSADEAAQKILEATRKKKFRAVIGRDAKALDVFSRMNPKKAANAIAKRLKLM